MLGVLLRVLLNHEATAIIAAFAAYVVEEMPGSAVGADGKSRDKSFVVCTTLRCARVGLSPFRMCHFSILFCFCYFCLFVGVAAPSGELGFRLFYGFGDVFIVAGAGGMLVEHSHHPSVALAQGMHMACGDGQHYRVLKDIGHVKAQARLGYDKQIVALIIVVIAIFHLDMIIRVHLMIQGIQTAVTRYLKHSLAMECAVIGVIALLNVEMHLHVAGDDLGHLHVLEELCATLKILLEFPIRQACELHFVL